MNSCKSTLVSAWTPPLSTLNIGTGRRCAFVPPSVTVERQVLRPGDRARHGERHAEDGVGAQPPLVRRAVEGSEAPSTARLVTGVHADERRGDLRIYVAHRPPHPLAPVSVRLAVAQLDCFPAAGRGPGGNRRPAGAAVVEKNVDLDGGIAPGVEDLPGADRRDASAHRRTSPLVTAPSAAEETSATYLANTPLA